MYFDLHRWNVHGEGVREHLVAGDDILVEKHDELKEGGRERRRMRMEVVVQQGVLKALIIC